MEPIGKALHNLFPKEIVERSKLYARRCLETGDVRPKIEGVAQNLKVTDDDIKGPNLIPLLAAMDKSEECAQCPGEWTHGSDACQTPLHPVLKRRPSGKIYMEHIRCQIYQAWAKRQRDLG